MEVLMFKTWLGAHILVGICRLYREQFSWGKSLTRAQIENCL